MPVHSVIVVNRTGNVLFSKYFDTRVTAGGKQYVFEQEVFSHTSFMWHQTSKQTVSIKDVHIVYQRCGELIIFIGGTNEVDEIIRKSYPNITYSLHTYLIYMPCSR